MTVPVVRFTVAGAAAEHFRVTRKYVVIYDGLCKVCTRLAGLLGKWDRREEIQVVPSQLPGVREAFPFIPARDYDESLQMIGPEGQRWQRAAAIEQLLSILPRGILIGWVFRIPLVRGIAERLYRSFARNRYRLGCGEHCDFRRVKSEE